jgi:hypothetical protein
VLGASVAGVARADAPYACWAFEFVPGERVQLRGLGEVQNGWTYYSDEFTITQQPDDMALAELFETHVRKTVPKRGPSSLFVSGCTSSSTRGGAQYSASRGHESLANEADGRTTNVHWSPTAAELAKTALPEKKDWPVNFMQCLLNEGYYVRFHAESRLYRSQVFEAGQYNTRDTEDELNTWAKANNIDGVRATCYVARTPERLAAMTIDKIEHAKLGSPVTPIAFRPTSAKASPAPKSGVAATASTAVALTVKTDTSLSDARRAWDAQVAQAMREEAQKAAQAVAKAARADAQLQAQAEKARQERLKRGRAQ